MAAKGHAIARCTRGRLSQGYLRCQARMPWGRQHDGRQACGPCEWELHILTPDASHDQGLAALVWTDPLCGMPQTSNLHPTLALH
jgi:hypothetical protein